MKLCYFGSDYPPTGGGISTYAVDWLLSVSKSKEVSHIDAYIFGNKEPRIEKVNDKLTVEARRTRNFFAVGIEILGLMHKNRDARMFHALYVFPVGFWTVVWSKFFRTQTIITIYGTDVCSQEGSALTRVLKRFTLMNATRVIAISNFTKEAAIRVLALPNDLGTIDVIYSTVPEVKTNKTELQIASAVAELKQSFAFDEDSFVVLSVCRLVSRKGIDHLIEAMSQVSDKNIKLLVVGSGPEKERLQEAIRSHRVEDRVFLLGKVPDLVPLYRMSDLCILPSFGRVEEGDFEGLGLVLLEAQSFGLPVIGTNSGGIPEAFDPDVTGILVPEKDSRALAEAIRKMSERKELYSNMAAATGDFLKQRFGLDRMLEEYLSLVR